MARTMSDDLNLPDGSDAVSVIRAIIPELNAGTVVIRALAYSPGRGLKLAVSSVDPLCDPIGAAVGYHGARSNALKAAFDVPRVEVVLWSADPTILIARALLPATQVTVTLEVPEHEAVVSVPAAQRAAAYGPDGSNLDLAARLTGWQLTLRESAE